MVVHCDQVVLYVIVLNCSCQAGISTDRIHSHSCRHGALCHHLTRFWFSGYWCHETKHLLGCKVHYGW